MLLMNRWRVIRVTVEPNPEHALAWLSGMFGAGATYQTWMAYRSSGKFLAAFFPTWDQAMRYTNKKVAP